MEKYDYIICGGGASGLLLSNAFIKDEFFNDKKILIIERESKTLNDKTFSFWDNQSNVLDTYPWWAEVKPWDNRSIENMLKLSKAGALMVPASPAFYNKPKTLDDNINFIVGRVLDLLGYDSDIFSRWEGTE